MGYRMSQHKSQFRMRADHKAAAFKALKKLAAETPLTWVTSEGIKGCRTLKELLEDCRWELDEDEQGQVTSIHFIGEKAGDDMQVLQAIAPFVEAGSFIE